MRLRALKNSKEQLIQGSFYKNELVDLHKKQHEIGEKKQPTTMSSQSNNFIINLVSNASTVPGNVLAQFTTLLGEQIILEGAWQVAVVEVSLSDQLENVTQGVQRLQKTSKETSKITHHRHRHSLHSSHTRRLVTMSDPCNRKISTGSETG